MAFAFAGRAQIGGIKTDAWLAAELEKLPVRSVVTACEHIQQRATEEFRKIHVPAKWKHHAFVGIGFIPQPDSSDLRPITVRISNYYDENGVRLDKIRDRFMISRDKAGKKLVVATHTGHPITNKTGHPITKEEIDAWVRSIQSLEKRGAGPVAFIRCFKDFIRHVSYRLSNKWVGKSLLAVALPKEAASQLDVSIRSSVFTMHIRTPESYAKHLAQPIPEHLQPPIPFFLHLPENLDEWKIHGPLMACPGFKTLALKVKIPKNCDFRELP
jgi:hypothetical protein